MPTKAQGRRGKKLAPKYRAQFARSAERRVKRLREYIAQTPNKKGKELAEEKLQKVLSTGRTKN